MKIPKILKLSDVMLPSNWMNVVDVSSKWKQQTIDTLAKEFDNQLTWVKRNPLNYSLVVPMVLEGQRIAEGEIGSIEWPHELNTKECLDFIVNRLFDNTEWHFVSSRLESGLGAYPDNYFYLMNWRTK